MLRFIPKIANYFILLQTRAQLAKSKQDLKHMLLTLTACLFVCARTTPQILLFPRQPGSEYSQSLSPWQKKRWSPLAPHPQMSVKREFSNDYRMQITFCKLKLWVFWQFPTSSGLHMSVLSVQLHANWIKQKLALTVASANPASYLDTRHNK